MSNFFTIISILLCLCLKSRDQQLIEFVILSLNFARLNSKLYNIGNGNAQISTQITEKESTHKKERHPRKKFTVIPQATCRNYFNSILGIHIVFVLSLSIHK